MEPPTEEDCCHSDCTNCVLDIYQRQKTAKNRSPQIPINTAMSQTQYKPFRLVKIEADTFRVNIYTFAEEHTQEQSQFYFKPGEHVVLRNDPKTFCGFKHLSKSYTIIPRESDEWRNSFSVVIKIYPDGQMSQYINQWQLGHMAYWRGPYGDFIYTPNTYKRIIMICMGTGIAPMYSISQHIIENEDDETIVRVLYGSKTPEDIILRKEMKQLGNYWNFHCTHFISKGYDDTQRTFKEIFERGQILEEHIVKELEDINGKSLVLICGSQEFNSKIKEIVDNINSSQIKTFVFS